MAEFEELRASVAGIRAAREERAGELFAAGEEERRIRRRLEALARVGGDGAEREAEVLAARAEELAEARKGLRAAARRLEERERGLLADFAAFADPRQNIGRLDDRHPILLFPLRLETRFKPGLRGAAPQLWVRVYPDDVAVDTFEGTLAEVEAANARVYWTAVWKAAGADAGRRTAWRALARAHGAGRAHWITQRLAPRNPADEPVPVAGRHVLVVLAAPPADRVNVAAYWRRAWLAGGDPVELQAALEELVNAVGAARADEVVKGYAPVNLADARAADVTDAAVAFLDLPTDAEVETQLHPWAHAARARVLPERLVLLGYNGGEKTLEAVGAPIPGDLVTGPDPGAGPEGQIRLDDQGELVVPPDLRWMVDFQEALDRGMAFRVELSPGQAGGFDQLFVLGVRLTSDLDDSRARLESLFRHHQASRKGLSLLPQGTPTNNTEQDPSGYTWREDPDLSYDHFFASQGLADPADWRRKRDGRWLAEMLGIDPAVVRDSPNYWGQDQRDAREMNLALWPATLGYFMDRMMGPVFDDAVIEQTRAFFTRFVSGRGAIPAIRVGAQPYGILPSTPYSRLGWITRLGRQVPTFGAVTGHTVGTLGMNPASAAFLRRLYALLRVVDADWTEMARGTGGAGGAAFVGGPGDPQQVLLDVLGLHPTSAEFHQRYAQSAEQLVNQYRYLGLAGRFVAAIIAGTYTGSGMALLQRLGYTPGDDGVPEILTKFFLGSADRLKGPLVDDRPLSETERVRAYRPNGDNYLHWLAEAVRTSHDTLRRQEGFTDGRPPSALLYLMLRHALDLGYLDVSIDLHLRAQLLAPEAARAARVDPRFVHVQAVQPGGAGESPWRFLYAREAAITGQAGLRVGDVVPRVVETETPYLRTQVEALDHLAGASTARLERAFVEHLDCCAYRLDAWWLGLAHAQLALMRSTWNDGDGTGEVVQGSWLGAFGWLEEVRPENRTLHPVAPPAGLEDVFARPGEPPLSRDPTNGGHILAPSLNHAVTAAVLRNGYLSNATPEAPDTLAVNLSSARVRLALGVVEGIRNGQTLGALLGYQLERGLHDEPGLFLDDIILELRRAFPLVAGKAGRNPPAPGEAIQAVEARNVVDGLALVEHVRRTGNHAYPYGAAGLPGLPDPARRAAVDRQVERLLDVTDAVSDLATAESVHQVVQGNYDRAAGTFDAYSKASFPPIPEVAQTPRSGHTLTHRVGLHLPAGLDPADAAFANPRQKGEPAIAAWLAGVLPVPADVACRVRFAAQGTGAEATPTVTAAQLGLTPVDLLYLVRPDRSQAMDALDDRVLHHVYATLSPAADSPIEILYTEAVAGKVTFFQLAPLVRALSACLLRSRPLRLTDLRLQGEAGGGEDAAATTVNTAKVTEVRALLQGTRALWSAFVAAAAATLAGTEEASTAAAAAAIEQRVGEFAAAASALVLFGFPNPGIGAALEWRRARFAEAVDRTAVLVARWEAKLVQFDALLGAYDLLDPATPEPQRFETLAPIERVLATHPDPPPADSLQYRARLVNVLRPAFVAALGELRALRDSDASLSALHTGLALRTPVIAAHDAAGLDLSDERAEIRRYTQELLERAQQTVADLDARVLRADERLADAAAAEPARRLDAVTEAARALLDPDFALLSEFSVTGDAAAELQNAWDHRAELLAHFTGPLARDFPVDDWFYGVARVREKMAQLEAGVMLADALAGRDLALEPLQLPFRAADVWLAMDHPETWPGTSDPLVIDSDRLLYTGHFGVPFSAALPQCGVFLDEWTEVVPGRDETAGLAFHYDRPNSEPPQTLLLATPADFTGAWRWDDLVDGVRETLEMARKRAVEPGQVDGTPYARFLPAVLSSVTTWPLMQSLNFAFNNDIQFREGPP